MEFDNDDVRQVVEEDRLSSLPDDLIHKIMSFFDMKFAIQTCLLSSRWKHLWKSMPCLNFSSWLFGYLLKFNKFVTKVVSHRNHQIAVSSVKLHFNGTVDEDFVRKMADYIFSHNVQQLTIVCCPKFYYAFPLSLFSSQSLKHLTLSNRPLYTSPCITPTTPWDFPSLTTMHLSHIKLCDNNTRESVDLFSKCVNLKNLMLKRFTVSAIDIITPRLSTLMLIKSRYSFVINLIAPQLENLTVIDCSINNLNAPPGLSSLCYRGLHPQQLSEDGFHSLNKVSISLDMYPSHRHKPYKVEDALKTINMLQKLHSVRYLTLNVDIVECLSSYPDLLWHHPSSFSNLSCLTIDSSMRDDAHKVRMSIEATNFFLENSPNTSFIMELSEPPPTKALKQKEAREKKAKWAIEIETHMKELQVLIDHENRKVGLMWANDKAIAALKKLRAEMKVEVGKEHTEIETLMAEFKVCVEEMQPLVKKEKAEIEAISSKEGLIRSFMENLPYRERIQAEARYSKLLENSEAQRDRLGHQIMVTKYLMATAKHISLWPLASQEPASSSTTVSFLWFFTLIDVRFRHIIMWVELHRKLYY